MKTLILPCVSFGSIGQLACDILVESSQQSTPTKQLHSFKVQPMVGNDPFGPPVGRLCTPLELFQITPTVSVLQIRSSIRPGMVDEFVQELLPLCEEYDQVVLLAGVNAAHRDDAQIQQDGVRIISNPSVESSLLPLEHFVVDSPTIPGIHHGGLFSPLFQALKNKVSSVVGLLMFVRGEGQNQPDGIQMGVACIEYLDLKMTQLKVPPSWASTEGRE